VEIFAVLGAVFPLPFTDWREIFHGQADPYLSIYLSVCLSISIYLKSQDYGDVSAGAQQGRLTMS